MTDEIKLRIEQINRGEIPQGYKKTEVGIVPQEWEETTLSELFVFKNGLNKEKEAFGNGTPIVNYTDVWKKRGLRASDVNGKVTLTEKEIENYNVKKGDVFFTRTSETKEEIGLSSVLLEDIENGVFSGFVLRARPKTEKIFPPYNQYCYSSALMRHEVIKKSSITTRALTSGASLGQVQINLPSYEEQQHISEILSKWDEAISLQEELIEKIKLRNENLINKILLNTKTKKQVALKDVLSEQSIKTKENNQHPVISSTKQGLFLQSEYFDKQVASEENIGYKILKKGQIVLSPQNLWLGNINYNDKYDIGIVSPSYKIFNIKDGYNSVLISTIMSTEKMYYEYAQASEQGASIVRRNLNMDLFYEISMTLPDIEEQNLLAKQITVLRSYIEKQSEKLDKMKQQQTVIQQLLLTGVVRV